MKIRNLDDHYSFIRYFLSCVIDASNPEKCWIFMTKHKRGRLIYQGRSQTAARVSWQIHAGPIPDNLHVLHECDVPRCVNPWHLFLGTHQDNMADKKRKGRAKKKMNCPICDRHDQIIGRLCTGCGRTVTYSRPEEDTADLLTPMMVAGAEILGDFMQTDTNTSYDSPSVPDSSGFSGFDGGDTGGGGAGGDF